MAVSGPAIVNPAGPSFVMDKAFSKKAFRDMVWGQNLWDPWGNFELNQWGTINAFAFVVGGNPDTCSAERLSKLVIRPALCLEPGDESAEEHTGKGAAAHALWMDCVAIVLALSLIHI